MCKSKTNTRMRRQLQHQVYQRLANFVEHQISNQHQYWHKFASPFSCKVFKWEHRLHRMNYGLGPKPPMASPTIGREWMLYHNTESAPLPCILNLPQSSLQRVVFFVHFHFYYHLVRLPVFVDFQDSLGTWPPCITDCDSQCCQYSTHSNRPCPECLTWHHPERIFLVSSILLDSLAHSQTREKMGTLALWGAKKLIPGLLWKVKNAPRNLKCKIDHIFWVEGVPQTAQ